MQCVLNFPQSSGAKTFTTLLQVDRRGLLLLLHTPQVDKRTAIYNGVRIWNTTREFPVPADKVRLACKISHRHARENNLRLIAKFRRWLGMCETHRRVCLLQISYFQAVLEFESRFVCKTKNCLWKHVICFCNV